MKRESLRDKIVRLSKELAECEDEFTRIKLRNQISYLKALLEPSEPSTLSDIISDGKEIH